MNKESILTEIHTAAKERRDLGLDMANLPNDLSIDELATELHKLTGKDVKNVLQTQYMAKKKVKLPFSKLKQAPVNTSVDAQKAVPEGAPQNAINDTSILKSVLAGLTEQPIQGKSTATKTIAHFLGDSALPTLGAYAGSALAVPAIPLTGGLSLPAGPVLGAMAGKTIQRTISNALKNINNIKAPTVKETTKDVLLTGIGQALGEKTINSISNATQMAKPKMVKTAAALFERTAGIPKESSIKALNETSLLKTAPNIDEAAEAFSNYIGTRGNIVARSKKYLGVNLPSDIRPMSKFVNKVLDDMAEYEKITSNSQYRFLPKTKKEQLAKTLQPSVAKLLTAREYAAKISRMGKLGKPEASAFKREWEEIQGQLDNLIEQRKPGYAEVRDIYNRAKIKETFNRWLPINKNNEQNMPRAGIGAGLAMYGAKQLPNHPLFGSVLLGSAALTSPKVIGAGIKTIDTINNLYKTSKMLNIPQSALRETYARILEKVDEAQRPTIEAYISNLLKDKKNAK